MDILIDFYHSPFTIHQYFLLDCIGKYTISHSVEYVSGGYTEGRRKATPDTTIIKKSEVISVHPVK
ncbi:MAG: hypothetical protein U9R01_00085 [candidate division WOR-3 bacterium]|nr:hypothetical protein [candidate division WOR-3 bacterium]